MRYIQLTDRTAFVAALLMVITALPAAAPASAQVAAAGAERAFSGGNGPTARVYSPAATFVGDEAVLVWEGAKDGVFRQRVDEAGQGRGVRAGLAANDLPPQVPYKGPVTLQRDPTVVALDQTRILSVWVEELQQVNVDVFYQETDVLSSRIVAQRFNRQARPIGQLQEIGDVTLGLESAPDAVLLSNGRVAVVWQTTDGESATGVYGRILSGNGTPQGQVFRIDDAASDGWRPAIAAGPEGGFVVAWQACCDDDGDAVFARAFDGAGEALGAGVQVNSATAGLQIWPAIASGADGGFLVAWMSPGVPESGFDFQVNGRPLDGSGAPVGSQMVLSQGDGTAHGAPTLATAPDGYLLAWTTWYGSFTSSIRAATVSAQGTPRGEMIRVSNGPVGTQWELSLATDGAGHYLAAWQGFDEDGNPSINVRPLALSTAKGRSANLALGRN
jgi:hypothetical protein